jgi:protein-S-isoprenylcysteine O-methyltransferase Ste14
MPRRRLHGGELFGLILLLCLAIDLAASLWVKPDLLRIPWLWANPLVGAIAVGLGVATMAVGGALGYVSHRDFNKAVASTGEVKELLTTGPYKLVRHPFYLSLILVTLAFFLLLRSYALLAALLAVTVVLLADAQEEERALVDRLGEEYLRYQESAGMFLPRGRRR